MKVNILYKSGLAAQLTAFEARSNGLFLVLIMSNNQEKHIRLELCKRIDIS